MLLSLLRAGVGRNSVIKRFDVDLRGLRWSGCIWIVVDGKLEEECVDDLKEDLVKNIPTGGKSPGVHETKHPIPCSLLYYSGWIYFCIWVGFVGIWQAYLSNF